MATRISQKLDGTPVSQHTGITNPAGTIEVSQKPYGTVTPLSQHSGVSGYTEVAQK